MLQNRNPETCLRRLMYWLDAENSLVVTDQKFSRDLSHGLASYLQRFAPVTINITSGVTTFSSGTEDQYCSLLSHALHSSFISRELFRNNMKKQPLRVSNVEPSPRLPPSPVYLPPRNLNSQPSRRPFIPSDQTTPELPADSLPYPSTSAKLTSPPSFRIELRSPRDRLTITKPPSVPLNIDYSSSTTEPPPPPPLSFAPPPSAAPLDASFESEFRVAPLPPTAVSDVKVKFSTRIPDDRALPAFEPEPLFDPAWRVPVPVTGRIMRARTVDKAPIVTQAMFRSAETRARKAQIAAQYPFLKFGSGAGVDEGDSGSSESYSSRNGSSRQEEYPNEVRSAPAGRKGGGRPRWLRA
jgi:hypothetical protein